MKGKKLISIALVLSMLAACAGCGKKESAQKDEKDGKETLTILIDGSTEGTDGGLITENIKGFEDKYNVKVNFVETPYAELHQKLMNVSASGGDDFDAVFVELSLIHI